MIEIFAVRLYCHQVHLSVSDNLDYLLVKISVYMNENEDLRKINQNQLISIFQYLKTGFHGLDCQSIY